MPRCLSRARGRCHTMVDFCRLDFDGDLSCDTDPGDRSEGFRALAKGASVLAAIIIICACRYWHALGPQHVAFETARCLRSFETGGAAFPTLSFPALSARSLGVGCVPDVLRDPDDHVLGCFCSTSMGHWGLG